MTDKVAIYQAADGKTSLEVRLEQETVWLDQRQMAELFYKDTDTIGLHIRNIYKEGELEPEATTEESSVVQNEGGRNVRRKLKFYNLDVIISVGYRVKSQRGTQFRQWATRVLRDHLVQGYTINQKRLAEQAEKLADMRQAVELLSRTLEQQQLVSDLGKDVLQVITDYAYACGRIVQDVSATNIHAGHGVAISEFPLAPGHGFADYLLYIDGNAAGHGR